MGWVKLYRQLKAAGVIGLNARNGNYIQYYNQRRLYPRVDDKILCKKLCQEAGMPVPDLYGVIATQHDAGHLRELLVEHSKFALKPANGSGGDGIMVIVGTRNERYKRPNGRTVTLEELEHHVSGILSGMFSLGGHPDRAMVEALVEFDPVFSDLAYQGVPDIRIIVFLGYPVMAMTRLPTRESDGRANLHQGAIGVGVDIGSGRTVRGTWSNNIIEEHPDTGAKVNGFPVPGWDKIVDMAARCYEPIGLGYLGVDVVLDKNRGPMILELNARPGLAIQLANQEGLLGRLKQIEAIADKPRTPEERIAISRDLFTRYRPAA